jgi:hypothetical protein
MTLRVALLRYAVSDGSEQGVAVDLIGCYAEFRSFREGIDSVGIGFGTRPFGAGGVYSVRSLTLSAPKVPIPWLFLGNAVTEAGML